MKSVVAFTADNNASWVRIKMAVSSPGLSYKDLNALDIFEFFSIYAESQRKNKQ